MCNLFVSKHTHTKCSFFLKRKKICFRTQQWTLKLDNRGQVERQSESLFKATQAEAARDATLSVNF